MPMVRFTGGVVHGPHRNEDPCQGSGPLEGPTESQAQGSWRGHAGAGFVGAAPVLWPTPLPVLI
jgi:hypothetical protein